MATAQWQPPADAIPWTPPEDAIPFEGTWDAKLSLDDNIIANADAKKLAGYTQIVQRLVPIPGTGLGEHAAAYYIPRQDRALFKALWRKQYASTQPLKQAGYGVRAAASFLQGFMDTGAPLAKMVGALPKLDEDQERFKQELIGERESIDPTIRPDTNVAGRTVQQVGRMAFPAVHMVAGGKVAGGVGKLAGAGKKGVDWLERIGVAASALPQTADQTYSSLVAQGVDADKARTITMFSAPIEAAIESILPDSLSGFRGVFRGTARQVAGKLLRQATVNYTKELSEELAQGIVNETAMEVGRRMDEKIPDKGYGNILLRGLKDMQEAALPLALMMAPGTAVSSTAAVMNSSARPGRLEELRGIRAKGFVSADDGQKAGIPGDTRKARLAAVDEEIAQLEQERKDASQVRENQGVPAPAGQVGEGGEVNRGGDVYQTGEEQVRPQSTGEVTPARTEEEVPVAEQAGSHRPPGIPPLKPGFVRVVHFGRPGIEDSFRQGLDYSKQGILQSTAQAWSNESDVSYSADDPRFKYATAYVYDVPVDDIRPHYNVQSAPGKLPGEYYVGSVPAAEQAPTVQGPSPIPTSAPPLSHRADKAQRWLANTVERRPADRNTPESLAQWITAGFDADNYSAYLRESGQTLEQALQSLMPPEPTAGTPDTAQTPAALPPVDLVAGAVAAAPEAQGTTLGESDIDKALESEFVTPTAPEAAQEPGQPKSKGVKPTPATEPSVAPPEPAAVPEAAPPPKNRGKKPPAFTQPDEQTLQTLANAQITLKATAKGWVATGIPEEMADELKADFQGKNSAADGTSSKATPPRASLTPLSRLRQKLNKLPPRRQADLLGRALERLRRNKPPTTSNSDKNA